MKKTIYLLFAAAAVISAASCQKIENDDTINSGITVTASFDNIVRTTPSSDGSTTYALWAEGDIIKVMGSTSGSTTVTLTSEMISEDSKKAIFTVSGVEGDLYAIYGDTNATLSEGKILFTIPEQDGTFAKANICVAKANGYNFAFQNATAIVKVVGAEPATKGPGGEEGPRYINYFSCTAATGSYYNGTMTADFTTTPVTITAPTSGTAAFTWGDLYAKNQKSASEIVLKNLEGVYYFAVAPGNTYSFSANSYKIQKEQQNYKVQEVKTYPKTDGHDATGPLTKKLERNTIYTVTPTFNK